MTKGTPTNPPNPIQPALTTEQQTIYFNIWCKAVDTQMHFNDMSARSRQFGLGFVAASLSFGIILLSQKDDFIVPIHV
jgi:hypothetical protein